MIKEEECYHIYRRCAGDESWDYCDINDKMCELMGADDCPVWREEREEDNDLET